MWSNRLKVKVYKTQSVWLGKSLQFQEVGVVHSIMSRFLLQVQSITSASHWMLHCDKMQSHELFIWPAFHTPSFVLFPFSFSASALPSSLINISSRSPSLLPLPFLSVPCWNLQWQETWHGCIRDGTGRDSRARPERQKLQHLDQIMPWETWKAAIYTTVRLHYVEMSIKSTLPHFSQWKNRKLCNKWISVLGLYLKKVTCILFGRPVTHLTSTRPATGAGRPDRFPSLRLLPCHRTLHGLVDLEPRSTALTMVFCCNGCSLALVWLVLRCSGSTPSTTDRTQPLA